MGAVAVHPSRKFLAVAEDCRTRSPNIYVYSYPDLKLRRVLQNGTERAYRCGARGVWVVWVWGGVAAPWLLWCSTQT